MHFSFAVKADLQLRCYIHPLARFAGLTLKGSVSLISRSPAAPYEISSLATPEGAASFLAPPPGWQRTRFEGAKRRTNRSESLSRKGELAPKATEGVHFQMHAFG